MGSTLKTALFALSLLGAAGCLQPAAPAAAPGAPAAAPKAPAAAPVAAEKPPAAPANPWESAVQAYEKADAKSAPPAGAVLFVGSSTIRMWGTLAEDFRPLKVIGRGVGGCQVPDMVHFVDRVVLRYRPRQIVLYAGDNDVASKRTAEQVLADFRAFVGKVRPALPDAPVHFLSIKPSPSRANVWPEAVKANRLVREYCEKTPGLNYIDTASVLLDAQGNARPEYFLQDMLHMNRRGYELWIPIIRAALVNATASEHAEM
ncbi:MAG: hypothetical protein IMZ66_09380 [Planctomycetes bacterium]|nr:hypothetical protein [Planctomycetota bacterium]